MLRSMGAAVCGVAIIFACSVSTKAAVRPRHLVVNTQVRADNTELSPFIGTASTYNPFRPDPSAGGKLTASGEAIVRIAGLQPFKRSCAGSLVGYSGKRPIALASHSLKRRTNERSSK